MSSSGCLPVSSSWSLVSMAIFLLFWYGPESPAQPICDQQTSNRCGDRIKVYEERLGYNNPSTRSTASSSRASSSAARSRSDHQPIQCDAPCLGISYRTKLRCPTRWRSAYRPPSPSPSAAPSSTCSSASPSGSRPREDAAPSPTRPSSSSFLFLSSIPYYLFALLTWLYLTVIFEIPIFSNTGYHPFTENPCQLVHRAVPGLDGARASSAAPSTPGTPEGRWSRR